MSKPSLFEVLRTAGLLDYGSHIPGPLVRDTLGITYPDIASKGEFDRLALIELGAMDGIKSMLLNQGKMLVSIKGDYRIPLPSENALYVEAYMRAAEQKLRRARKLLRNSPAEVKRDLCNLEVRLHMKSGT